MLISDEYRKQNQDMHKDHGMFGNGGSVWAGPLTEVCERYKTQDVLDYGCGKGSLAKAMKFKIREYDPAVPGKDSPPEPADVVVCTDVLEHIEPEHLEEVLDHLQSLIKVCGLFTIATRKAKKKLPDGRNAHLIVAPAAWWLGHLEKRFKVVKWDVDRRKKDEVIALVKQRRDP